MCCRIWQVFGEDEASPTLPRAAKMATIVAEELDATEAALASFRRAALRSVFRLEKASFAAFRSVASYCLALARASLPYSDSCLCDLCGLCGLCRLVLPVAALWCRVLPLGA